MKEPYSFRRVNRVYRLFEKLTPIEQKHTLKALNNFWKDKSKEVNKN